MLNLRVLRESLITKLHKLISRTAASESFIRDDELSNCQEEDNETLSLCQSKQTGDLSVENKESSELKYGSISQCSAPPRELNSQPNVLAEPNRTHVINGQIDPSVSNKHGSDVEAIGCKRSKITMNYCKGCKEGDQNVQYSKSACSQHERAFSDVCGEEDHSDTKVLNDSKCVHHLGEDCVVQGCDERCRSLLVPGRQVSNGTHPEQEKEQGTSADHTEKRGDGNGEGEESIWAIAFQIFVPFFFAGFGTCGAGLELDIFQDWPVFRNVTELFIILPILIEVKAIIEGMLASRISTQSNLGRLNGIDVQWRVAWGNICLVQYQAAVLSVLSVIIAVIVNSIRNLQVDVYKAVLVASTTFIAMSLASLITGTITILTVILSQKCHINPDNVAISVGGSVGDVLTVGLLGVFGKILYNCTITPLLAIVVIFLFLIPVVGFVTYKNPMVKDILFHGWIPIIIGVAILSCGGFILEISVRRFHGIAVFQPLMIGLGCNLGCVQASRLSTSLHRKAKLGTLPLQDANRCEFPCTTFFSRRLSTKVAWVIIIELVIGHLFFGYGISLIKSQDRVLIDHPLFVPFYLLAAVFQVSIELYLARVLIYWMWTWNIDPDNNSIAILSSTGNFLGVGFLTLAFYLYSLVDPSL